MKRREFLRATAAGTLLAALPAELLAQTGARPATGGPWNNGAVRHLLPTISDTQMLLKASFDAPLAQPPILRVGALAVPGRMTDTRGEMWAFHATGLTPGRRYPLSLNASTGRALCQPWDLCARVGTHAGGWPSGIRKVGATPPLHLTVDEQVKPIEQHGFTLADFTPDTIVLRFFKWDVKTQGVEALDTLEPFHTAELQR